MSQAAIGAMVLDLSMRTDKDKVAALLNLLVTPFDYMGVSDILDNPVFESKMVTADMIVSGLTAIGTTEPCDFRFVPSKKAAVMSWMVGNVSNYQEVDSFYRRGRESTFHVSNSDPAPQDTMAKLLLRVNSDQHEPKEYENYTARVHDRLTSKIQGDWCGASMFLGVRPTIAVARCGHRHMYFSLLVLDNCLILVWSSEQEAATQILSAVDKDHAMYHITSAVWVNNIVVFRDTQTVVIHPIHLLSKVRHLGVDSKFDYTRVVPKLEAYLSRGSVGSPPVGKTSDRNSTEGEQQ